MAHQISSGPRELTAASFSDPPKATTKAARARQPCRVTFTGPQFDDYIACKVQVILDFQNPRIVLSVGPQGPGNPCAQLAFTVETNVIRMGIEEPNDALFTTIQGTRRRLPQMFDSDSSTALYLVELHGSPVKDGEYWKLEGEEREKWETLCGRVSQSARMLVIRWWNNPEERVRSIHSWFAFIASTVSSPMGPATLSLPQTTSQGQMGHTTLAEGFGRAQENRSPPIKRSRSASPVLGSGPQEVSSSYRSRGHYRENSFDHQQSSRGPYPNSQHRNGEHLEDAWLYMTLLSDFELEQRRLERETEIIEREREIVEYRREIAEIDFQLGIRRLERRRQSNRAGDRGN
ncbi:hypothetical protein Plec18167_004928 [Paecilomyces lecythidis]|uniref:Uncharacterized protein n=1 Tax=Paecilomyces lecythidis TaxID=3004212 RepID=A0ABR3XMM9_9EURO